MIERMVARTHGYAGLPPDMAQLGENRPPLNCIGMITGLQRAMAFKWIAWKSSKTTIAHGFQPGMAAGNGKATGVRLRFHIEQSMCLSPPGIACWFVRGAIIINGTAHEIAG